MENILDPDSFGSVLRERRRALHLTQLDVADFASVQRQTVAKIERGDDAVSFGTVLTIASILGLKIQAVSS